MKSEEWKSEEYLHILQQGWGRWSHPNNLGGSKFFTLHSSLFTFLLFTLLLVSCSAEQEFSTWPCRFSYNNQIHNNAVLASAMNSSSRGMFCLITESTRAGVKYLNFQTSDGQVSDPIPESAEESQAQFVLGLNNGIIIGYQTLNTDGAYGGFIGYDVQCPNCVRNENNTTNPNYRITMSNTGIATCPKCDRKYDMNNNGILQNGSEGDSGLEKYVAATSGPFGIVSVFRR